MDIPVYLGDGLYAEFVNGQVCLFAHDGERRTNEVFLEPFVLEVFLVFVADLKKRVG